jgi:hypothetical protein
MISILANKSHQHINGMPAQAPDFAGELAVFIAEGRRVG